MNDNQRIRDYFIEWRKFPNYNTVEQVKTYARIKQSASSISRYLRRLVAGGMLIARKRDGKSYMEYHLNPEYVVDKKITIKA